jgi:hypothetical protein
LDYKHGGFGMRHGSQFVRRRRGMVRGVRGTNLQELNMSSKWSCLKGPAGVAGAVSMLCILASPQAFSQVRGDPAGQEVFATAEDYQRYEAERRRQEQMQLENERRRREALRFETERLRQENERRQQEQLQLENEQLRQEIERLKEEQLRLEGAARERARLAAIQEQEESTGQGISPDTYQQLQKIGQLRDDGILTEEEFQRLKSKILD